MQKKKKKKWGNNTFFHFHPAADKPRRSTGDTEAGLQQPEDDGGFSSGKNQINESNQVIDGADGWWEACEAGWGRDGGGGCSHSDVASSMADVR